MKLRTGYPRISYGTQTKAASYAIGDCRWEKQEAGEVSEVIAAGNFLKLMSDFAWDPTHSENQNNVKTPHVY